MGLKSGVRPECLYSLAVLLEDEWVELRSENCKVDWAVFAGWAWYTDLPDGLVMIEVRWVGELLISGQSVCPMEMMRRRICHDAISTVYRAITFLVLSLMW